jgi:hypothetical protein
MTEGGIARHLITFAAPLLIGNLFQQLYNTVDTFVVGNFVGKEALAAVGSVSSIINTLIGFFLGLATGGSVVISQYYGARDDKGVQEAVHTTLAMTFILCAAFTLIGVLMVPYMLRAMSTPDDVFFGAAEYLRIYFLGVTGVVAVTVRDGLAMGGPPISCAGGRQAGPRVFRILCRRITNTPWTWRFCELRLGLSAAGRHARLCVRSVPRGAGGLIYLPGRSAAYKITCGDTELGAERCCAPFAIGMRPARVQRRSPAFSNVFVQGYINQFGSPGWRADAYPRLDRVHRSLLPWQALSLTTTTSGPEPGRGQFNARHRPVQPTLGAGADVLRWCSSAPTEILFPRAADPLFNTDPEAKVRRAVLRVISRFLFTFWSRSNPCIPALSGAGENVAPMANMLSSFVAFRQIYLFVMSRLVGTVLPVAFGYPVGWVLCGGALFLYYRSGRWEKRRVVVKKSVQA